MRKSCAVHACDVMAHRQVCPSIYQWGEQGIKVHKRLSALKLHELSLTLLLLLLLLLLPAPSTNP